MGAAIGIICSATGKERKERETLRVGRVKQGDCWVLRRKGHRARTNPEERSVKVSQAPTLLPPKGGHRAGWSTPTRLLPAAMRELPNDIVSPGVGRICRSWSGKSTC